MSRNTIEPYTYQPETYLRPGANYTALGWIALIGLPVLLLFLIYAKLDEMPRVPTMPAQQQSAHH